MGAGQRGEGRRIGVMSITSRAGVFYALDGESVGPGDERSVLLVWSQGGPIDPMLLYEIIALWAGASGGKLEDSEVNRRLIAPLAAHRGHSLSIGSIRHRRNGVALENFARSLRSCP